MRSLPSQLSDQYGTIVGELVRISFPTSGVKVYGKHATGTYTDQLGEHPIPEQMFEGLPIISGLVNTSGLDTQIANGVQSLRNISIEINDINNDLSTLMQRNCIEGATAEVFTCVYNTNNEVIASFLQIIGRLTGIAYSNGTLKANIDEYINSREVIITSKNPSLVSTDQVGKPWPIVFGTALKVPAFPVATPAQSTLSSLVDNNSRTLTVMDPGKFPVGITIDLSLTAAVLRGSFDVDGVFTITDVNPATYSNIPIASRVADEDLNNGAVLWITGSQNLAGQFICLSNANNSLLITRRVLKQVGSKLWLDDPVRRDKNDLTPVKVGGSYSGTQITKIYQASYWIRKNWPTLWLWTVVTDTFNVVQKVDNTNGQLAGIGAYPVGSNITWFPSLSPVYIANAVPSSTIYEVAAYRTIDGVKTLQPVPSSRYSKELSSSFDGIPCTKITLVAPLSTYEDEGWEDQIYVSLTSTIDKNIAAVLNWIIEGFTNLVVDNTSYAQTYSDCAAYPCGFALLDARDAIQLASDIAYQGRVGIYRSATKIYFKYLSKEYSITGDMALGLGDLVDTTLSLSESSLDQLSTIIRAKWRRDYTSVERTLEYTQNDTTYGALTTDRDFYIYNIESLVKKSLYFYGYRASRIWKQASLSTPINKLNIEVLDQVGIDLDKISSNTLRGTVYGARYTLEDTVYSLTVELASVAGVVDGGNQPYYDSGYYFGDPSYPISGSDAAPNLPIAGLSEVDYIIPGKSTGRNISLDIKVPLTATRGSGFTVTVRTLFDDGSLAQYSGTCTLALQSPDSSDVLTTSTLTVTNGVGTVTTAVTGGTGADSVYISGAMLGYVGQSVSIVVDGTAGGATLTITTPAYRDIATSMVLTGGLANTTYNLGLSDTDSNTITPTSITTDGAGAFNGSITFSGGVKQSSTAVVAAVAGASAIISGNIEVRAQSDLYPMVDVKVQQSDGRLEDAVTAGVPAGKHGYLLGFTEAMSDPGKLPKWLRDVVLGMSLTGSTSEQASFKIFVSTDGDYILLGSGGITRYDRSAGTTFSVCDVATITTDTTPPSAPGKKGQMHMIY